VSCLTDLPLRYLLKCQSADRLAAGFEPSVAFPAHQQMSGCGRYRIGAASFQGNDLG